MSRANKRLRVAKNSIPKQRAGECYEPPPRTKLEKLELRVIVDTGVLLVIKKTYRRGTSVLVSFAITISNKDSTGEWRPVWRMDTWHDEVHTHQFRSDGQEERQVLEPIPTNCAPDLIERWCTKTEYAVQYEWQEYLRRWNSDGK